VTLFRRGLQSAPRLLLPLAVTAALVALLAPSGALAERSDLVLAALVLFTALGIPPSELAGLRSRKGVVAGLVFAPFALLVPLAWAVSRLFDEPVREGILTLGVASTEVAAVGLVALAGGSAVLALGVLAGSLVVAALAGPPVLGLLAQAGTDVAVGELVGRFALVVVLPLALGLAARARFARLSELDAELAGMASVTVVLLLYCAMSGAPGGEELLSAAAGSALFLLVSLIAVAAWAIVAPKDLRFTGALVIELRDFAVAAALAAQAFGPPAATVAAVYGVLMLLLGAAAAHIVNSRGSSAASSPPAAD
jgi:predicted Na+-dependent transporter